MVRRKGVRIQLGKKLGGARAFLFFSGMYDKFWKAIIWIKPKHCSKYVWWFLQMNTTQMGAVLWLHSLNTWRMWAGTVTSQQWAGGQGKTSESLLEPQSRQPPGTFTERRRLRGEAALTYKNGAIPESHKWGEKWQLEKDVFEVKMEKINLSQRMFLL